MPSSSYSVHPCDEDPRRWQRCLDAARQTMLAAGWIERSGKFGEVRMRKARQLWRKRLN